MMLRLSTQRQPLRRTKDNVHTAALKGCIKGHIIREEGPYELDLSWTSGNELVRNGRDSTFLKIFTTCPLNMN